jgi:TusA-related sulfurtransferase
MSSHTLDERGKLCPYPVIALGHLWQELQTSSGAHSIDITADDPVAIIDIPAWCQIKGANCERLDDGAGSNLHFRVTFTVTE